MGLAVLVNSLEYNTSNLERTAGDPGDKSGDPSSPAWRNDPLRDVARKAAEGHEDALQTLLMEVGGAMLRTVRKVLGANHPNVDDVAQEAALGLLQAIGNFRGECSVMHFSVRVALRTALHARRHLEVRQRIGDFSNNEPETFEQRGDSPLDALLSQERRRILRSILDGLSPAVAESVALHFVLGMTVSEIAESEAVSPNTIWSRLRLGKESLRTGLMADGRFHDLRKREER